jgi:heterodisulfide reductase subunit A2
MFDARRVSNYGYGRLPNVFTSLEFERLSNAAGPTNGNIVLRDGKTVPKSVGIIHCVGSRDRNFNNYCSVICCMQGLKFAHLVHERTGATVYNFYIDMRTAYKAYDEFYQRVLEEGTSVRARQSGRGHGCGAVFQRKRQAHHPDRRYAGGQAEAHPCGYGHPLQRITAASRREGSRQTLRHLLLNGRLVHRKTSQARSRRYDDRRHLHRRLCAGTEGYSIQCGAGCGGFGACAGQNFAKGSCARTVRATVNKEMCSGCRICNGLCPFNAIAFLADDNVSEINPALCQGCGTCVAACPAGAISGTGFSNEQIIAQIDGLLLNLRMA